MRRTRIAVQRAQAFGGAGYVRVPNPIVRPGTILDAGGNPYRAPRDPLKPRNKAAVETVLRDLPISPLELHWTPSEIRLAIIEHMLGSFTRSSTLIDAMMGDDRIQSSLGSRIGALLGLDEVVTPAAEDTSGAVAAAWGEAWKKCHAPPEQGNTLYEIRAGALMGGLHVSEIVWDTEDESGLWMPYLKPWHLSQFFVDMSKRALVALTEDGPVDVVPGDGKWFVHAPFGVYRGQIHGLVRSLAFPWLLRQLAHRDWARSSERHGLPILKALVPAMGDAADKLRFENDLTTMGSEAVVVLPQGVDGEGYDLELLEASAQSWQGFDQFIARIDTNITLAIQWQNLTTEVKEGSEAAARVHGDVKQTAIELDDNGFADDVHAQLGRPFAAYNYGNPNLAPRISRDVEPIEDRVAALSCLESFSRSLASLRAAGDPIDVEALARKYRVNLPMGTAKDTEPTIFGYHLAAGIVKRNEARQRLGLPPIPGPDGEALLGSQTTGEDGATP